MPTVQPLIEEETAARESSPTAQWDLAAQNEAVHRTRRHFSNWLKRHWPTDPEGVADFALLLDELLANAALHGCGRIQVHIRLAETYVYCEVRDGSDCPPVLARSGEAEHGRGIALVAALSDGWGVRDRPSGKAVWFVKRRASTDAGTPDGGAGSGMIRFVRQYAPSGDPGPETADSAA